MTDPAEIRACLKSPTKQALHLQLKQATESTFLIMMAIFGTLIGLGFICILVGLPGYLKK